MPKWLLDLLGVDLPPLPEGGTRHLEFAGIPQGEKLLFLILFGLALMGATAWLYRREGKAETWKKAALAGLRILVIMVAFCIWTEPQLGIEIEKTLDSVTLVLIDNSLSMSIKDRLDRDALKKELSAATGIKAYDLASKSRAELVEAMLARKDLALLNKLGERNTVRMYTYGQRLVRLEAKKDESPKVTPKGQTTDLTGAIRGALEDVPGKTIAGIVVIGDGRVNSGEHPSAITGMLKERKIPLFTIGFGNPDPPKNYEVVELLAPPRVYKGDPVLVEGSIRATGYAGESVEVSLERRSRDSGKTEIIGRKAIKVESERFQKRLRFTFAPKQAGEFLFSLKIEPREDELLPGDNVASRVVRVIKDDARILLISSGPSFEYRFLRVLLEREKTIQLSCWLQSADSDFTQDGNVAIKELPRTDAELGEYGVIIMIDPDEEALDQNWLERLEKFVWQGGGLCYVAGDKHSTNLFRSPDMRALKKLLPVEPDTERATTVLEGRRHVDRWGMKLTADGEDHAVTRLAANPVQVKSIWSRLPGFYWAYPVRSEKPGASVLLRSKDPTQVSSKGAGVLLAAHNYGPGRTVFSAMDSTWRWRRNARWAYERYWIQLMRYLVEGRLLGGQRRLSLATDKDGYSLGDVVGLKVKVLDASYKPLANARLTAQATVQDGADGPSAFEIRLEQRKPGEYAGQFVPPRSALYEIVVGAPDMGLIDGKTVKAQKTVRVSLPNIEFSDSRRDDALLRDIAEAAGGEAIPLAKVAELPGKIPARRETLVVTGTPVPLWDNRLPLLLIALFLGLEWFFRKRCKMV